jgi:hypothetical protein
VELKVSGFLIAELAKDSDSSKKSTNSLGVVYRIFASVKIEICGVSLK